jgi:hypothetical protein
VGARARVCLRACVRACVCMCEWVGAGARARACACARVALSSMQRACAILSSAATLAPPYFSTLAHKRRDFRKSFAEHKMCVLIFSTSFI